MSVISHYQLPQFAAESPTAILFDLDGTLVDSVPDLYVAVARALDELQLPPVTELQVRSWVGNGARKLVQRALACAYAVAEHEVSIEQLNIAHKCFLKHYADCNGQSSRLCEGVLPALQYWQKQSIPMAIVTNKPIQFVPQLLAGLNIDGFFSLLIGGECVSDKKPAPMMLLQACRQLPAEPERCLMIGDSRNDVEAAKAAGMPVAAVTGGYNHGEAIELCEPHCVIDSIAELLP